MKNYKDLIIHHKLTNKKKKIIFYNNNVFYNYNKKKYKIKYAEIAGPYGLSSKQIKNDHDYLFRCYQFYLKEISKTEIIYSISIKNSVSVILLFLSNTKRKTS